MSSVSALSGMMDRVARLLKRTSPSSSPEYINGYRVRRGMITCPVCSAPPKVWCYSHCTALDLLDYR